MSTEYQQQLAEERERSELEALWAVAKVFPEEATFLASELGLDREFNRGMKKEIG